MPAFLATSGSFKVAPGKYALVAEDWKGDIPNPKTSTHGEVLTVPVKEAPSIEMVEGLEMLVIPIGCDEKGSRGRTIEIGDSTIVAFGRIALVAVPEDDLQSKSYPYASHISEVVVLEFGEKGSVSPIEGGIDLFGCNPENPIFTIDTKAPGAFIIEDAVIDMTLDIWSESFGYGQEVFNEGLDEHGIFLDLIVVRDVLKASSDPLASECLKQLSGKGPFATAYYAPFNAW